MFGVYVHIPYCIRKCNYCAFFSQPLDNSAAAYAQALGQELALRAPDWQEDSCASIYLGGGTPSILPAGTIPALLNNIRETLTLTDDCEITCEANPESFTAELAAAWKAAGVHRLSFGLQATQDNLLDVLGRPHAYQDFLTALDIATQAGFRNINADLMFALPGQTLADWEQTLQTVSQLPVQHLSCYGLQLEEGTPLHEEVKNRRLRLPSEDEAADMYDATATTLTDHGFIRYEISNFAHKGFTSRHNINYWQNGDYLALGAGAHGTYRSNGNTYRYENLRNIPVYIEATKNGDRMPPRLVSPDDDRFNSIMLGTRMLQGVDMDAFAFRHGVTLQQAYAEVVQKSIEDGLAQIDANHFRLTLRGLDMQNSVLLSFMGE